MNDCYAIVCNCQKGRGRYWLGRNPQNNAGVWMHESLVTKDMADWWPVLWKVREGAEKTLEKVKMPGAYILHFQA